MKLVIVPNHMVLALGTQIIFLPLGPINVHSKAWVMSEKQHRWHPNGPYHNMETHVGISGSEKEISWLKAMMWIHMAALKGSTYHLYMVLLGDQVGWFQITHGTTQRLPHDMMMSP